MSGRIIGSRHICDVPKQGNASDEHGLIWQCDICGVCYSAFYACGITKWERYTPSAADEIESPANELERLRALIHAWADCDDGFGPECDYDKCVTLDDAAAIALRKAVGR